MNAMTKLARKAEQVPVRPEDIRQRIDELRATLNASDRRQYELAEASIQSAEAEREYNELIAAGATMQGEVDRLSAALASMDRRATETVTAEQTAAAAQDRARVAALLDDRIEAARAFEAAITAAVGAYHSLLDISDRANLAWPGSLPDQMATALGSGPIVHLVAAEMFRQGGAPTLTGGGAQVLRKLPPLPAPKWPAFDYIDLPQNVPPLVTAIMDANVIAKEILEGKRQ